MSHVTPTANQQLGHALARVVPTLSIYGSGQGEPRAINLEEFRQLGLIGCLSFYWSDAVTWFYGRHIGSGGADLLVCSRRLNTSLRPCIFTEHLGLIHHSRPYNARKMYYI
jgi:hypothetical protein